MISRFALPAALLLAAGPAVAQPAASAPAQAPAGAAAMEQAAQAFGQCVGTGMQGLAATVTPEAGAASILAGCAAQRQRLEQAAETMIAGASVPDAQKTAARQQLRERFGSLQTEIATAIRQGRTPAPGTPPPAR